MMFKVIVFDYDGVIIDSFNYHLRKYNEMFPDAGLTARELADVHNGNFLERDNDVWSKINIDKYDNFLMTDIVNANLVFPNTKHLLSNFKVPLYIVTSGPEAPLMNVLKKENLFNYFKGLYGKETNASKVIKLQKIMDENNLAIDEIVFVTDTLGDILEANKVGIKTIAVTYGFHTKENLERGNPWRLVNSEAELEDVILQATT